MWRSWPPSPHNAGDHGDPCEWGPHVGTWSAESIQNSAEVSAPRMSRIPKTGYTKTGYMSSGWDPSISIKIWGHWHELGAIGMGWGPLEWIGVHWNTPEAIVMDMYLAREFKI